MQRLLLLIPFFLWLLVPVPASGGWARLAWDHCRADSGTADRTFDCSTNSGTETIVGSFELWQDLSHVVSVNARLWLVTNERYSNIPDWWQVYSGGCRAGGLTALSDPSLISGSVCVNAWLPVSANTHTTESLACYEYDEVGTYIVDVACTPSVALEHGVEYLAFALVLSHAKSVGEGACAGCGQTMVMGTAWINVQQEDGTYELCGPSSVDGFDEASSVLWQPPSVGARAPTWGAIKSLYR